MPVKDYYAILKVPPGADAAGIKKAFRALAMEYHPDKRKGNKQEEVYYREIQDAYQVLSDPRKREEYLYQRWLEKSLGHALDNAMSAEQILQLFIKAEQYIAGTDHFRMDKLILLNQLKDLFSDARLETLLTEGDAQMETTATQMGLRIAHRLDFTGTEWLFQQLKKLLAKHPVEQLAWEKIMRKKRLEKSMDQLKIPLVLVLTMILCYIIFKLGK